MKLAVEPETDARLVGEHALAIPRSSLRHPYSLMITSLLTAPEIGASSNIRAAIFITDADDRQLGMRSLLGKLYRLTPAEADLAALLGEGESLENTATLRGVSINTARSQLKSIFRKTGTRRQGDLVALVLSGLSGLEKA